MAYGGPSLGGDRSRGPSAVNATPLPDDLRLVVVDMDGTLLDGDGRVPDALWPLLDELAERRVWFVPASGRQYAALERTFHRAAEGMFFIAENGAFVVRDGQEISSRTMAPEFVADLLGRLRGLADRGVDLGVVVCRPRSALIERTDPAFTEQVAPYYAAVEEVTGLGEHVDGVIKVAVHVFGNAEAVAPELGELGEQYQLVVSGPHWIDVMDAGTTKGAAVRAIQDEFGIGADQTAAFGDYLNDLSMFEAADWSFAMANAHPEVLKRARLRAPANTDQGVVAVLRAWVARNPG